MLETRLSGKKEVVRVAVAQELAGIDGVAVVDWPTPPEPSAGQVLVRVHCAGVGPWDVGMLGGGFPGLATPFVPGQELSGVVEVVGVGAEVQPGQRVYATTFPTGGGFAEFALVDSGRVAVPGLAPGLFTGQLGELVLQLSVVPGSAGDAGLRVGEVGPQ
jgi:NADPH:quinone reductase-like Zn-dependent oxidoreductase